ncbi:APC amino acid permease [Dentipellis sp. KUC8613]|nr:APC amino acid permease [Dentipellis sp. KUC8613]
MHSRDEELLATLGYKQELRREFSPWELFGISFSIIGVFPSMASVLLYAIPNGGPLALVWGWAVSVVFLMFIGLAMAELGSAAPTSGGLYYWTHTFSSPRYKNVFAWIVGYCNSLGLISGAAAINWGFAVQLMAAVSIGKDMTLTPTTAQTFGVFVAVSVLQGIICSAAARYIARLQTFYIIVNIAICVIIFVGLPAATPQEFKNSAKVAFGDFENFNGWPDGFAFIFSFLSPLWTIAAFDPCVHISEEASNAATAVPWAILSTVIVSGVLGWAVNIALAFNMGTDLASIIDSPIGQPMATILFNGFGKRGTLGIWALVVVAQFMMGTGAITVGARQLFAFSRDGGLPFSRFLRRVSPHTHTPLFAVWAMVLVAILLGLLAFAGPNAISAIFSLGVVAQYTAYTIPIAARYLGKNDFKKGPFHLGIFSLPVAVIAVAFMSFMIVIFTFPTTPNPTTEDMNYTVVVSGGVVILSLAYYFFPKYGGRYWFQGPIRTVEDDLDVVRGEKDSLDSAGVVVVDSPEKIGGDLKA